MKRISLIAFWIATLAIVLILTSPARAADFTLSEAGILSLDNNMSNIVALTEGDIFTATILSNQDIPGTGVVFTIHFPSTNFPDNFIFWTSNSAQEAGALAGLDVNAYSNFVLKCTVLAIDESTNITGNVVMGALIDGPDLANWAYRPEVASLGGSYPASVVSTIDVTSATIDDIGFVVYEWPPGLLSAGPHDITILVQPADRAVQLPVTPPLLTYDLEKQSHGRCRIDTKIETNLNVVTTNTLEICKSVSFNLTVTNTGYTNTPPFQVRAWAELDPTFNPKEPVRPQTFRVKSLKNNQVDVLRLRGRRYSNNPFLYIYITDTNNNVLTSF